MTRQMKTPRQRAEEQLGVAQRRVARVQERLLKERDVVYDSEQELVEAKERLEYAAADPALVDAHLDDTTTPEETP